LVEKAAEIVDLAHPAGRSYGLRDNLAVFHTALEGVTDLDPVVLAVAEIVFYFFVQIARVDHDLANAVAREMFDQIGQHGLAEYRDHRLGQLVSQRLNPRALACCEDHGFHSA
jgi:hypothetical protein